MTQSRTPESFGIVCLLIGQGPDKPAEIDGMCPAQSKVAELLQGLDHLISARMIADLFQELKHLFFVFLGERTTPHVGFVLIAAQHLGYDFDGIVFEHYGIIESGLGPVLEE